MQEATHYEQTTNRSDVVATILAAVEASGLDVAKLVREGELEQELTRRLSREE